MSLFFRYDEIWDYNFCYEIDNNNINRPGREGKDVGHFTQVDISKN